MLAHRNQAQFKRLLLAIIVTLIAQFGAPQSIAANLCAQSFRSEASEHSLYLFIRGHASDYWSWVKSIPTEEIPSALMAVGRVIGDPHLRNFADANLNGKRKIRVVDLDDNGRGPFLFDFVKFVTATLSQRLGLKTGELFEMYHVGLREEKKDKPKFLEEALDRSKKSEKKDLEDFLKKMTEGNSIVFGVKTDLYPIEDSDPQIQQMYRDARLSFKLALKNYTILDKAVRLKKTGGTLRPRFWYLVETDDGKKQLIEFKQVGESALSALAPQTDFKSRMNEAMNVYWKGERDPLYQAIQVGEQNYFMRPGYKGFLDFTDLKSEKDKQMAREMLLHIAYHMGRMVAGQKSASEYIDAINENPRSALKLVDDLASEYLTSVKTHKSH